MDIAAIINAAIVDTINSAVAEAIRPLQERIAALETKLTEAALFQQTTEVNLNKITADAFVTHLDQQEWFWAKINNYIDRNRLPTEMPEAWLEDVKEIADAAAEDAVNGHCNDYDHDDYDRAVSAIDDFEIDEDMVKDTVKEMLRSASVSIEI